MAPKKFRCGGMQKKITDMLSPSVKISKTNHAQDRAPKENNSPFPVSLDVFKSYLNCDELVNEILKGKAKDDAHFEKLIKNPEQCEKVIKKYYETFYLKPKIRGRYKYRIKACPATFQKKLLSIPNINDDENEIVPEKMSNDVQNMTEAETQVPMAAPINEIVSINNAKVSPCKSSVPEQPKQVEIDNRCETSLRVDDDETNNNVVEIAVANDNGEEEKEEEVDVVFFPERITFFDKYIDMHKKLQGVDTALIETIKERVKKELLCKPNKTGCEIISVEVISPAKYPIAAQTLEPNIRSIDESEEQIRLAPPVTFEFFKAHIDCDEIVLQILKDIVKGNDEKLCDMKNDSEVCEQVLKKYYHDFYFSPNIRCKYKYTFKKCDRSIRQQILASNIVTNETTVIPTETPIASEPIAENNIQTAGHDTRENVATEDVPALAECSDDEIERTIEELLGDNNTQTTEPLIERNIIKVVNQTSQLCADENVIEAEIPKQIVDQTNESAKENDTPSAKSSKSHNKFPVTFDTFKKYVKCEKAVLEYLKIYTKGDKARIDEITNDPLIYAKYLRKYYELFYLTPEVRDLGSYYLKPCPLHIKQNILSTSNEVHLKRSRTHKVDHISEIEPSLKRLRLVSVSAEPTTNSTVQPVTEPKRHQIVTESVRSDAINSDVPIKPTAVTEISVQNESQTENVESQQLNLDLPIKSTVVTEISVPNETQPKHVEILPKHVKTQPKHAETQPKHAETQPKHVETLPKHVEIQPNHVETHPKDVETVPNQVETVPNQVETHKKQMETQPKHVETQPKHVEIQPEHVEIQPKHVESQPKHVETQPKQVETQQLNVVVPIKQIVVAEMNVQKENKIVSTCQGVNSNNDKTCDKSKSVLPEMLKNNEVPTKEDISNEKTNSKASPSVNKRKDGTTKYSAKNDNIRVNPLTKPHNLYYVLSISHGLKYKILKTVIEMSFEEFKKITCLYVGAEIYDNEQNLHLYYRYALEEQWPISLYIRFPCLQTYIQSKGVEFDEMNLEHISPNLLHWSELMRYTNFDDCVRNDYYNRCWSNLTDPALLAAERERYYARCWTLNQWIGQVPIVESCQSTLNSGDIQIPEVFETQQLNSDVKNLKYPKISEFLVNKFANTKDPIDTDIIDDMDSQPFDNELLKETQLESSIENVMAAELVTTSNFDRSTNCTIICTQSQESRSDDISFVTMPNTQDQIDILPAEMNVPTDPLNLLSLHEATESCEGQKIMPDLEMPTIKQEKEDRPMLNNLLFSINDESDTYNCEVISHKIISLDDDFDLSGKFRIEDSSSSGAQSAGFALELTPDESINEAQNIKSDEITKEKPPANDSIAELPLMPTPLNINNSKPKLRSGKTRNTEVDNVPQLTHRFRALPLTTVVRPTADVPDQRSMRSNANNKPRRTSRF